MAVTDRTSVLSTLSRTDLDALADGYGYTMGMVTLLAAYVALSGGLSANPFSLGIHLLLIVLGIVYLACAGLLFFSRQIMAFLTYQQTERQHSTNIEAISPHEPNDTTPYQKIPSSRPTTPTARSTNRSVVLGAVIGAVIGGIVASNFLGAVLTGPAALAIILTNQLGQTRSIVQYLAPLVFLLVACGPYALVGALFGAKQTKAAYSVIAWLIIGTLLWLFVFFPRIKIGL